MRSLNRDAGERLLVPPTPLAKASPGSSFSRENAENMYFFSKLALTLNEPEDGVAPTDSRLRPDQRLMENGKWDEANMEKQRLEEKQRAVRRHREVEAAGALAEGTGKLPLRSAGYKEAPLGCLRTTYPIRPSLEPATSTARF